jgi:hypothetical protein
MVINFHLWLFCRFFGTFDQFESHHKTRKQQKLNEFFSQLAPDMAAAIGRACKADVAALNLVLFDV